MPQIGPAEIIVILLVGMLVFGPSRLPEIGKQVGRAMREVKKFQARSRASSNAVTHLHEQTTRREPARFDPDRRHDSGAGRRSGHRAVATSTRRCRHPTPRSPGGIPRRRAFGCRSPRHERRADRWRLPCSRRRRGKRSRPAGGHMPIMDHLGELRRRVLISALAVVVCATVMFFFSNAVITFLVTYYKDATHGHRNTLIFTGPVDGFITRLKIATYGGIVLALPDLALPAVALHHPGTQPEGTPVRDPVRALVGGAVRHGRGRRVPDPRARAEVPDRRRRPVPDAAVHLGQVPVARVVDGDRVRALVRVPGDPRVPADCRACSRPHSCVTSGAGRSSGSWCSPR